LTDRIKALRSLLSKNRLDGYLVSNETNMFYLTEVVGATALWIPNEGENLLYAYSTNYEAVKATAKNCQVERLKRSEDPYKKLAEKNKGRRLKRIGFDTLNATNYLTTKKTLKGTRIRPAGKLAQDLRSIKEIAELASIKKAAEITDSGVRAALEMIKPGVREYEVAAEMEHATRKLGSEGVAFDTIVASGARSAFPHGGASGQSLLQGGCTNKKIERGEFIVIDVGARYNNYRADLTRTYMVGKPTPKQKEMYEVVKEAQQKAFEKIKAGVKNRDVDAAARNVIEKAGLGQYFVHGLGHGVGLEVHEAPTLNAESKERLKAGNVVTDEPGIYIVGYGGVRIEDTVAVHKSQGERLTKAPYELEI
jgi:Xaa-Pro aminopeptidase